MASANWMHESRAGSGRRTPERLGDPQLRSGRRKVDSYALTERCSGPAVGVAQQESGQFEREIEVGGRRWTRTSGLLHVKHFRLSAVLRAWEAERKGVTYTVTRAREAGSCCTVRWRPRQVTGPY